MSACGDSSFSISRPNVPKWETRRLVSFELFLVFTARLMAFAYKLMQCTRVDVAGKHIVGDSDVVLRFWGGWAGH